MKKTVLFIILFALINSIFAQNAKFEQKLFNEYLEKCKNFSSSNKIDSTAIYLLKLDKLLVNSKDSSNYYKVELQKGTYLTAKSAYDKAMHKLLKATSFFKLQQDFKNYYYGSYKIGVCYYYVNRREDAKKIMLEVINNPKFITKQMETNAYSNLGALEMELGMLNNKDSLIKKSRTYLKKAISLNKKSKNYTRLATNYSLLSESYYQLKNVPKALTLIDSAMYFANKSKDKSEVGFALIKKATMLTAKKQYHKALKIINKAVTIHQDLNHIPTLIYAYIEKKKLLVAMQNYKEANAISDSIYNYAILNYDKRFADGISEMKVQYKTAEKEREILEQRADIAEKGLLIQKRNYQIYGVIGLGLLLSVLGFFIYKQQKLKNKQLIKENTLKVALRKIETQNKLQEQRLRISRDLHDNIGAQLSFIISSVDNLQYANKNASPEFNDKLVYISEFTSHTINQLRDTIWAMNKNEISLEDLHSRILAFIEKAKIANKNITFTFNNTITSEIVFTSIKGMHIFRVIQEAINNSLKYAEADKINIQFKEKNNSVVLTIQDNGKGFNKKTVQLGNGLRNMQDRINEIDGEFEINSSEKGTKITITCKMDKTDKT